MLGEDRPGPALALRADMDALPIREAPDCPTPASKTVSCHACGHDAHTALLLGAARRLQRRTAAAAPGPVFLFQPAEEAPPGGAVGMTRPARSTTTGRAVFGLHVGNKEAGT